MSEQHLPNWDAFGSLQEHYLTCSEVFSIESCEFAMERCLAAPKRKAVGKQLANDLLRDGRRVATAVNNFTAFNEEVHPYGDTYQPDFELDQQDAERQTGITLSSFFKLLSLQDKEVLTLALQGISYTNPLLSKYTDIGARMFRYILTKVRTAIQADKKLKRTFFQAINILGYKPEDFIHLINN